MLQKSVAVTLASIRKHGKFFGVQFRVPEQDGTMLQHG
jgi:2-keto-3-deoxy-L-rhamnonate aldolase RhmA